MSRHTIDQMDAWSAAQLAMQSKANDPYFYTSTTATGTSSLRKALERTYNAYYMEDKTEMNKHETKINQYGFEKIIQNGSAVIVFWTDKTKTVVKLKEDDQYDIYAAVAQALAKKIYGCNSVFHKMVDKVTEDHTIPMDMELLKASTIDSFKKFWDGVWNLSHPKGTDRYSGDDE